MTENNIKISAIIRDVQRNCDISDARDHGIYSMCTMVLKLRNLYKWENGLDPWQEPEPGDLLDWIEEKENGWQRITEEEYKNITVGKSSYHPSSLEDINKHISSHRLYYGAGYGRSMKSVFFLAGIVDEFKTADIDVTILGREVAREMASPFAMAQDGKIIIRKDALRYFLWDQVQELRGSCRSSFRHALDNYGLLTDGNLDQQLFRRKIDAIVEEEIPLFIHHEVGEILQKCLDSSTLERISMRFPSSAIELVCRTIKDVLADTHENGLLAYCIREKKETSLSFYLGFLDGLRKMLFPEIFPAWEKFLVDKEWRGIEKARQLCWQANSERAECIRLIVDISEHKTETETEKLFNERILSPLGLDAGQQ